MRVAAALWAFFLAFASGTVQAQESWKDTHRVYLRNGSTVDGRLEKSSDPAYVILSYAPNIRISLKSAEVLRVEVITIRSVGQPPPQVDVPRPPRPKEKEEPPKPKEDDVPLDPETAELLKTPGRRAAATLVDRLESLSESHRAQVLPVLAAVDSAEPIEGSLRKGLQSVHADVREAMLRMLTARKDPACVSTAAGLIRDKAPGVRAAAAEALGALGDASHLDRVADAALDAEAQVRSPAISAAKALAARTETWPDLGRHWLNRIRSGPDGARGDLAMALGSIAIKAGPEAVEESRAALTEFLTDRSQEVRLRAVIGMSEIRDGRTAEAVRATIEVERVPEVQAEMCNTLTKIGVSSKPVLETLIELLRSPHAAVRVQSERALKNLTGESGLEGDYDAWSAWFNRSK